MNSSLDDELHYVRRKAAFAFGLFVLALGALGWRLWDLQVRRGGYYYAQAKLEALQPIPIPAARGEILDTNGRVLAKDVPSFAAMLSFTPSPLAPAEVSLLATILGLSPSSIEAAAKQLRTGSTFVPQLLRADLTPAQYTAIAENAARLPGVSVQSQPVRTYPGIPGDADPGTSLAANLLGYVLAGQTPGDVSGADGVEKSFNTLPGGAKGLGLAGTDGHEIVEVDPKTGHPVRRAAVQPPVAGNDVVLTIDAQLQAVAQRALSAQLAALRTRTFPYPLGGPFPDAYWGSAVVIDVRTGAILAMASEPTFDPNVFASGAEALPGSAAHTAFNAQVSQWLHNLQGTPLTDHAISDTAPPGSTFKPATAIAALQDGVITASQHIPCPAEVPVGNTHLRNWIYPQYGGDLNLTEALARSCDTYFYNVGDRAGIAAIDRVASAFGLGSLTGQHALYGESAGQLSSPAVASAEGQLWVPATTMQSAIGQGLNAFTALQMAVYAAALANGGTVFVPQFVREVRTPRGQIVWQQKPQVRRRVALSPDIVTAIHQAMEAVTQIHPAWKADQVDSDFGTAYYTFYQFTALTKQYLGRAITIAGKTGTAQLGGNQTPDGWFISYAPASDPQIAVVVMTEHGDEGFVGGGPVAREIYDYYFGLDCAMWKAGAADQIIPPAVKDYFGQSTHYPDWWGPPPAPATGAAAAGGTGGACG